LIVDASALVASLGNRKSEPLLLGQELAAPDLLIPETLNAFWKLRRAGRSVPALSILLSTLDHIRIVPSRAHAARAAELADRLDHPVYDCLYLALAEAEADVVITADAAFERKARNRGFSKRVRLVSP
jgi:predicted nucleic acid-binding protein